jgi:hypothetical protein
MAVKVTGFKGDVIGDSIAINPSLVVYDLFSITDYSHTQPILYFGKDTSKYAGFRYDNGTGNRLVWLDLELGYGSYEAGDGKLFRKSFDFLLNGVDAVPETPSSSFTLDQNYPNPVVSGTKIGYSLTERTPVILAVHDLLGREIRRLVNTAQDAGAYTVNFDASNLPSGLYIYTLNAGGKTVEKTMTITK